MFGQREQKIEWRKDALQTQQKGAQKPANFLRAALVVTTTAAVQLAPHVAWAAEKTAKAMTMTERIGKATAPLMELSQAIAQPVAYIMISCGFILIMAGKREAGFQLIRNGAIGFIGLMFVPVIMQILVEIGRAMLGA